MSRPGSSSSLAEIDATAADWVIRRDLGLSVTCQAEFEQWKAADPRHIQALSSLEAAWTRLDRPRSGGRAEELMRVLSASAGRRRRRRRINAALAGVAIMAFAGVLWTARSRTEAAASASRPLVLLPETRRLTDGSVVELKSGAEIAVDYTGIFRRVQLMRGEALFQVAKNKERPFIVTAAGIDVRAVGTSFVVGMRKSQIDVIVTEGQVAVGVPPEKSAAAYSTLLAAGRKLAIDVGPHPKISATVTVSAEEIDDRLGWRAARLDFSHTPLADAVELFNAHSKLRLVVADPALAAIPVTGLFRANQAEVMVRLLEANFGIKAERDGDTITLRKAP